MYKNLVATGKRARMAAWALCAPLCFFAPTLSGLDVAQAASPSGTAVSAADKSAKADCQHAQPLKVGFVYVTPVLDVGWTHQHDLGRQAVAHHFGPCVQTTAVPDVPEGPDAERVIRDLATQGHGLIVTTSFGYAQPTLRVAREFPQVKFESITGIERADNVATANARQYEGRYLAGVAAGQMSKSGQAGFVVGFAIPEVLQGVNAFTLGMRSVNPQATVRLIVLGEWFNPAKERDAAMSLMDQGADVLAFQVASSAVMKAAEERGKLAVAFHSDMRHVAPNAQLLALTHHWDAYDIARVQAVMGGSWTSQATWSGLKEGMVRVGHYGPQVPASVQTRVTEVQQQIVSDKKHPFTGPVSDREGQLRVKAGQAPSDADLQAMNWLTQGVLGALP